MSAISVPIPTRFLQRICTATDAPIAVALCPDFEDGAWRFKRLADHVFDWLPDVALRPRERQAMLHEPHRTLAHSCRRLFDLDEVDKRGEIGEILLHAICRQEFSTTPLVARLFYKMRSNDSVTSVDVVHLLHDDEKSTFELWMGEAKLYSSVEAAKRKALKSIQQIWSIDFLSELKALIGPKIESDERHAQKLDWLFSDTTSLDKIVERLVIPICIACDFIPTSLYRERDKNYIAEVENTLIAIQQYFLERTPKHVKIVCIFLPMDSKKKLETAVNKKVKSFL
ncbi:MAG: DUF1837 domain-containing protein [Actinomycetospora chiangmaiensis]|nr:DUF1837 domain-containing protein [Actinomycetospora chiangmaiensis]